ncbi:hypothetical protein [Sphaerisporangium album]|uniref:hypothetical protein n=1 Tax=Sphaerisporangium album TaxID=509200 RepID=UPI0015EFFF66|nr:hypothetical protein [Sphaerisporangium album]
MVTLASFTRRLTSGDRQVDVELAAGQARWLDAQEHAGENIGDTETLFIELKEPVPSARPAAETPLGPGLPYP